MQKLLITLLLISPFSFADWGEVYYCQMTTNSQTTLEGERTDYQLKKFQFKLDKTKNAMVFGKAADSYFAGKELKLELGMDSVVKERWHAGGMFSKLYFAKGKFLYSFIGVSGLTSLSADCDKF